MKVRESAKTALMVVASVPMLMGISLLMASMVVWLMLLALTALPALVFEHWRGR